MSLERDPRKQVFPPPRPRRRGVAPHALPPGEDPVRDYSPRLAAGFLAYLRIYLARHFDSVRVFGAPPSSSERTVFYANHPSWWDPLVLVFVLHNAYPEVRVYGPMEAAALQHYAFFKRCGVFGITPGTWRGAANFLRLSRAVLAQPRAALCVTAEGRFADSRVRPVRLARGVAHLLHRGHAEQAVPIALELAFWNERKPVALLRFGDAVRGGAQTLAAQHYTLETALERELDALAEQSIARDPSAFECVLEGTRGVGGVYDWYRRARARLMGRKFDASHGSVMR
jgi:1-acyl-sn-glycerol-3-phosphate acyltransferase